MKLRPLLVSLLTIAAAPLSADVTHRMALRIEPSHTLPPDLVEAMTRGMGETLKALSVDYRVKGNRASMRVGTYVAIMEFDRSRVTLLDQTGRRFATVPAPEYVHAHEDWSERLRGAAVRADLTGSAAEPKLRMEAPIRPTGKKKEIRGIPVEEYELRLGVATDGQGDAALAAITFWIPTPDESRHNPLLRELDTYVRRAYVPIPYSSALTEFSREDALAAELDEAVRKLGVPLEIRSTMGVGPGSQIIGIVMETTELSADTVPASVFEVPSSYRSARLADLLPEMLSQTSPGAEPVVVAPVMAPGTEDPPSSAPDYSKPPR